MNHIYVTLDKGGLKISMCIILAEDKVTVSVESDRFDGIRLPFLF